MHRLLILALFCATLLLRLPQTLACGGYEITGIDRMVEFADVVVSGRVKNVDDLGNNFILKVERYFKGSGSAYLPIVGTRPAWFYADTVRNYSNGCYNVRQKFEFREDDYGYFALMARSDATFYYWFESVWIPGEEFYERTNTVLFRYEPRSEDSVAFFPYGRPELELESPLPVRQFESLLLKLSDQSQAAAPKSQSYPLMRFLYLTTESGERYRLNPDYSVTHLDPEKFPVAISNDGSHIMFRLDYDELAIQYMDRVKKAIHPCAYCEALGNLSVGSGRTLSTGDYSTNGWLEPIKGWYARFSPDSNFVAVQESDRLVIYMLDNWMHEQYGYGQEMRLTVVAGQTVWWHPHYTETWDHYLEDREPLEWSADSTTLAYQDERGIWRWDIFEETHPQLALATNYGNRLLDISRSGRYVRYGHDETWSLIDVTNGESYERAIATPDERNLIFIKPAFPKHTVTVAAGRKSYARDTSRRCRAPLTQCPINVTFAEEPIEVFEYQPGWLGLVSSSGIMIFPWQLAMEEGGLNVATEREQTIKAFDFDGKNGIPAIAFDAYSISFHFSDRYSRMRPDYGRFNAVNLENELDSPIVDLEWGQPIFYEGR